MHVKQFHYSTDNLSYLIHHNRVAFVIDGGAVDEILAFLNQHGITLKLMTNTHSHPDHTCGNKALLRETGADYIDHRSLKHNAFLDFEGFGIQIYQTPGHSFDSIVFHAGNVLITGDTLFNGTVGNPFSNDLMSFYQSICLLRALPPATMIYAGHDYVKPSMEFARYIEPDNPHIESYLKAYTPDYVHSTLEDELKVNPYLRFNEPSIVKFLTAKGLPVGTEYERWESIMKIE